MSAGSATTVHVWPIPYETGHQPDPSCTCSPSRSDTTGHGYTTTTYRHRRLRPPSEALG